MIVGDKPYTQTVIALANCLTWPKGDHYSIMIIRDAFLENFSVTDLLHDFDDDDNDFQVTGRKILRCLVCDEVYIQLIDQRRCIRTRNVTVLAVRKDTRNSYSGGEKAMGFDQWIVTSIY